MTTPTILSLLLVAACGSSDRPPTATVAQTAPKATMPTDSVMNELADAFARKDLDALNRLVSDSYSGLRFSSSWTDTTWKRFAAAFRTATPVSSTDRERVYELRIEPEQAGGEVEVKRITLAPNNDGQWQLIYRTFMVTPHM